ncbi:GNAT family N-acetyltransferase [Lapillicoccus jejuensis]|uniref:N-acetyltransferase domain-containing protein n=1 Tax=Lapillicoccus jejuensis TaxID=402171 RepID=A0A542E4W7_9MICO|nr:GNAT family N-acetyltransferase [Lapillicoccus jejuensis]TQJ10388.1 hypothetical protein FB458_3509 [Lapillicoccus jejuensis]
MALTTQQVLAASDAWLWVPEQARSEVVAGVPVVDYPDWAHTPFWAAPLDTGRPAEDAPAVVAAVAAVARERGKPWMTWWLSPSARPVELADALLAVGAVAEESCDIVACDLAGGIPDVGDVAPVCTEVVQDAAGIDDFGAVSDAVWGPVRDPEARRATQLADLGRPLAEQDSRRVVGHLEDRPVAVGGLQVADGVARLYGAATRPEARGRGAYRAVLHRRLVEARALGATTALVHARVGTSGPILRRCGFEAYGVARSFRLDL